MNDDNDFEDRQWSTSIVERTHNDDNRTNRFRLEIRDVLTVGSIRLGQLFIRMEGNEPHGMSLIEEPGIII